MKIKLVLAIGFLFIFSCGVKSKPLPPLKTPYIGGAPQKDINQRKKEK